MAFYGELFSFDGVSSAAHDLMMYEIGGSDAQGASQFASESSIIEERLPSRWRPLFIGTEMKGRLEFVITFGVNQERIDAGAYLTRNELDRVATWLTGHDSYKYLTIEQDDLTSIRYKCIITNLQTVEYGMLPWAFQATVTCDSQFAYRLPTTYTYNVRGSTSIDFNNLSSINGYYKPTIVFEPADTSGLEIINHSDGDRSFRFSTIPGAATTVAVDNENCVITNSADINLYRYFNYNFLRLIKGVNELEIVGNGVLKIECEFPVNVGG